MNPTPSDYLFRFVLEHDPEARRLAANQLETFVSMAAETLVELTSTFLESRRVDSGTDLDPDLLCRFAVAVDGLGGLISELRRSQDKLSYEPAKTEKRPASSALEVDSSSLDDLEG
jgi:hypothetical protein